MTIGAPLELPWENGLHVSLSHVKLTEDGAKLKYALPFSNNTVVLNAKKIETEFCMRLSKRPVQEVIEQTKWGCMAAALAMLTGHSLYTVSKALGRHGWRNDDGGCQWEAVQPAVRDLDYELIWLTRERMYMLDHDMPKCIVTVPSLNFKGKAHALTYINGEMLDPNMNRGERLWYGAEWHPHTIGARGVEVLLKRQTKIQYEDIKSMQLAGKDKELIQYIKENAA